MSLVSLIYFSEHRLGGEGHSIAAQVNDILRTAIRNNEANGITGALIFDEDKFVQVLEGERDDVWAAFEVVAADPRHARVSFVRMEAAPARQFGAWPMGCVERNRETATTFSPYLRKGSFQPAKMTGKEIMSLMLDLRRSLDFGQALYADKHLVRSDRFMRSDRFVQAPGFARSDAFMRGGGPFRGA